MMNDANIDHLMQITLPRANWPGSGLGGGRDDRPVFDDHLAQASAPRGPVEPPRPPEPRTPKNTPPSGNLPSRGEATRPEVEENSEATAPAPSPNSAAEDDNTGSEEASGDASATEQSPENVAEADHSSEETDGEAASEDDGDHENDDELAQQIELAEAAAAATLEVAPKSQTAAADPAGSEQPAETVEKVIQTTNVQQKSDDPQPTKSVDNPVIRENAQQVVTPPVKQGAEIAAHIDKTAVEPRKPTDAAHRTTKTPDAVTSQIAKSDRPTTTSKRQRSANQETEPADKHNGQRNADESQKAETAPQGDRPAAKTEKGADEARESIIPKVGPDRQPGRSDTNNSAAKSPAVPVANVTQDTAKDPAKSETTDESVGPKGVHGTRSDAQVHPLARLQRGNTFAARGSRDAKNEDVPRVDATRFVSRVAKAIHTAQERGGTLQLRLSPPELGAMRLELLVQDGVLAAKLETETPAARRVLLDHLPVLRERLAEQNIRIERFDVDVRQENNGHSPPGAQEQQQRQQHGSPHRQPTRQAVPAAETISATPAIAGPMTDTQINLVA
jgi:flagellar hook-length control protein FliK